MNTTTDTLPRARRGLFSKSVPLSHGQNKLLNIFFYTVIGGTFVSMLGVILYYVYAYASLHAGSHGFDWLLGIFSDFVYIMNVSLEESPYIVENSSYPPIAIAVLYPFALICKSAFAQYSNEVLTVDELTARIILYPQFWVAILLFFFVCSALIVITVTRIYRLPPRAALKVGLITVTSAPFAYAVMRGNTIYFALIFLLLFLLLYKNENPVLREIGYICLVLAGLIKIYPLFFGVFLLCDKKIWASVRVGIYTVLLFLLSFFMLDGGINDFLPFLHNLGEFASNDLRISAGNNLSLTSLLHRLVNPFFPGIADSGIFGVLCTVTVSALFAVSTVSAVYTRSALSRCIIASATVILIPTVSYFYVLVFMLPAFMEFIKGCDTLSGKKRMLYTVSFAVIMFTPLILSKNFILQSLAVIVLLASEYVSVFGKELRAKKQAR